MTLAACTTLALTHTVLASKYNPAGSQPTIGSVLGLGNETKVLRTSMLINSQYHQYVQYSYLRDVGVHVKAI